MPEMEIGCRRVHSQLNPERVRLFELRFELRLRNDLRAAARDFPPMIGGYAHAGHRIKQRFEDTTRRPPLSSTDKPERPIAAMRPPDARMSHPVMLCSITTRSGCRN